MPEPQRPEEPTAAPAEDEEEISYVWVLVGALFLFAVSFGAEQVAEAWLDDPSWLAKLAVMAVIEVPILVLAILGLVTWLARQNPKA